MLVYRIICIIIILGFIPIGNAQAQQVTLSGQVRDATNGELLGGVVLYDSIANAGATTNNYGFFSLTLPQLPVFLRVSHIGYITQYLAGSELATSRQLDIRLSAGKELAAVTIVGKANLTTAGAVSLSIPEIRNMPTLLGEADVLKSLSYTPGVATGNEGSAGLYVRGGTPDQNLILLDEVPVYNVMHLGGFFSVFNPASLKNVALYKGPFPARYGGRLSSVIDLTMKEGNNRKLGGEVGLGLLNQSLTLEGPILKNKASFIFSGRISTLGLTRLLSRKRTLNTSGEDYVYNFYDLNLKFNYQINKTDQVYLSVYNGFDRFTYTEWKNSNSREVTTAVGNNWGNLTGTLRYSKMISSRLFARAVLLHSMYTSQFTNNFTDSEDAETPRVYRDIDARVRDIGLKMQFDYFPKSWLEVRTGVDLTRHIFHPFKVTSNYSGDVQVGRVMQVNANQLDVFVDADLIPTKTLKLNTGLRYNLYSVAGLPYSNPEPRLGFNWNFAGSWKFNGGFSVMNQYIHLLTNNGYGFGYDAWVPATARVPPSRGSQYSLGFSANVGPLELTIDGYSKQTRRLIDYPDGTSFTSVLTKSWDDVVASGGRGRMRGLEFMIHKPKGKLNGRISYTLSKSELQFDNINKGNWYPMKYDRRHNLSVLANLDFNSKWSLNAAFVYQTGHAVTLPVGAFLDPNSGYTLYIYNERNNGRMPDFHRLDIGAGRRNMIWKKNPAKLSFGLYNAYNRANPIYLDFGRKVDPQTNQKIAVVKQYSLFALLPYINYSIQF